jgi:hypothetical protein
MKTSYIVGTVAAVMIATGGFFLVRANDSLPAECTELFTWAEACFDKIPVNESNAMMIHQMKAMFTIFKEDKTKHDKEQMRTSCKMLRVSLSASMSFFGCR